MPLLDISRATRFENSPTHRGRIVIWLWSICKLFRKFALERRKSENTKEQAKFVREQP